MAKDNYQIQAAQAKQVFLGYDQQALIRKCALEADDEFLYVPLAGRRYRIHRVSAEMTFRQEGQWHDGNSHAEVMTLLDLLCDSREDRHLSGRLRNMQDFGMQFHQGLLEKQRDPMAERIQRDPEKFRRACRAMGGTPGSTGDICYTLPLFEALGITVQFWMGDEEFAPRLRYLWDENALQYLRYETMYYAVDLVMRRVLEEMK